MNEYTLPSMANTFHGIFNFLLMALNCLITIAVYALLSAYRRLHVEIHAYREFEIFLDPPMVNFFLRREFIAVPLLLLAVMFVKEFSDASYKSKVQLNMFILAAIFAHSLFIVAVPYFFSLA